MTWWQIGVAVYLAIGAWMASSVMVEVETERNRPGKGSARWFVGCITAALVGTVIWLPVCVVSLFVGGDDD